jgi:hypothetical protein
VGIGAMHEMTAWDEAIEEGRIKAIRLFGRTKFGEPDPETDSALSAIRDPDRIDRLIAAMIAANSWQELLATP